VINPRIIAEILEESRIDMPYNIHEDITEWFRLIPDESQTQAINHVFIAMYGMSFEEATNIAHIYQEEDKAESDYDLSMAEDYTARYPTQEFKYEQDITQAMESIPGRDESVDK
jgi:hypothetical protein